MARHLDIKSTYTVTGVLAKTPADRKPEQFLVNGRIKERWSINGRSQSRNSKGEILVPLALQDLNRFLEKVPLGTKVIFEESDKVIGGQLFTRTYSVKTKTK